MIVRTLLVRGMVAGLIAGLVAFVVARVVGEPALDGGIAFEDAMNAATHEPAHEELVSRAVQANVGLGVAYLVYGVAIGGILALVFAVARGRLAPLGSRATAVIVTLLGFVSAVLVPLVKYPANPPASTEDDTIGSRTGLFLLVVVVSIALMVVAVVVSERLTPRLGRWNAVVAAGLGYLIVVLVVGSLLPAVAETPADFPSTVLYDFRAAALGTQAVLWGVYALVFGTLVHERQRTGRREQTAVD
ncbi:MULTISPECIES: CbtA family protein [Pseudonocardia]|uniref:Membrane protein n=2 Tax=Pseudonocardia TaxID=1847 RepID=A0ABQ0S9I8_9PSEU|nr:MULTISPECIES: CbtA family protein [Pseudonocardia]OSY36395.1 putative cobalt transporter subunit (CbtA) [Pseudonocardia autotrophica]TDN72649.1 putative cobalt transporter subunit CbtA [Pseudonocardia autotrophica]BBG03361.1 membrane protein [Pseudonocardia autotrophica]GEC29588.1 membrane protein [Pseudonocardia saturnea]